ncbi:uncharacterized protein LOC131220871 isoform X2 [Magnolia sinica]|uniref:uncharacterized protein LOC131220871 isoform X2 n=1 Tax=Magnolia sinica TaxID=86752 RepID=UPI00265A2422|nr:uncharacterized protein LOC131220871 isoform X2 [Magnolia sinica]
MSNAAAGATEEEEEERQRRQRKLEEALEVKSLRRIISAYLKCIYLNSFFILNMLQAFDPPLDMSQDTDICEHETLENIHEDHIQLENANFKERNFSSGQHASTSGRTASSETEQSGCREGNDMISKSPKRTGNEEMRMESFCESVMGSWSLSSEFNAAIHSAGGDDGVKVVNDKDGPCSVSAANGDVNSPPPDWLDPSLQLNVPLVDVDKVRCIIRNIVRDWALEGQRERDQCYKPILEELDRLFPNRCKTRPPCCLVPGAGLGRLALDISCLGFASQGNEFSYYMMICSSFILNHTQTAGEWTIYPWIHSNCNSLSDDDQFRPIKFPDIHPASAGITEGFSMCGGDFVEVYNDLSQHGAWDAVVTCFFLDTAHNIVEYIEIISRILKDGGVWINLGPLLYHFADTYGPEDEMSIELSLEDVKKVAFDNGFKLEMEKTIETTYTANLRSMMQTHYFAAFWTMKKGKAS